MVAPRATWRSWRGARSVMGSGESTDTRGPPMTLQGSEPRPHSTRRPHVYCPACGNPLGERLVEGRSLGACAACDFIAFRDPKVVAVTALIEDTGGRPPRRDPTPAAKAALGGGPPPPPFTPQTKLRV